MTAGEELLLDDLLARHDPLLVNDLLGWHQHLPAVEPEESACGVELVAALLVTQSP